jgi:CheY-like chemotaxis protein
LAFSRKSDSSLSPLDLNLKVEEMVSMSQRVLPKEIAIETGLQADLPRVNCDAGQIDQVLMNLVTNARDAMPEGGRLTIETRGVVLGEEFCRRFIEVKPGDYALLTVTDTGSGMDQPTLERMYDPFFTTKEVGKGTGLGLSTVLGIVKNHGGHIFCDSAPGRGTTFNIYLPIPAQDISRSTPGGESTRAEPHGGGRRILLVDDEQSLRALGSRALTGAGYDVLTASSGEEALNVLGQGSQPPTLVVLDLGMPGMGGLKCLRSMLELSPGLKVLIATGYAAEAQVKEALAAGAAGYVAKPFKRAELLAKIRSVFDSQ